MGKMYKNLIESIVDAIKDAKLSKKMLKRNTILVPCHQCKCKDCSHTYYFGGNMPDNYCYNCDFCDLNNGYGDFGKTKCDNQKCQVPVNMELQRS